MRTLFLVCLLCAAVFAAEDVTLTGKWQVQRIAMGNESQSVCTLTQKDGALTGTCTSDGGPVQISGKVTGSNVTWTYKSDSQGGPVTVVYEGKVESGSKITGKVTAVEFSVEGEFTATRAK
jgi:hypothetical protein